jgi:hypothetical protein
VLLWLPGAGVTLASRPGPLVFAFVMVAGSGGRCCTSRPRLVACLAATTRADKGYLVDPRRYGDVFTTVASPARGGLGESAAAAEPSTCARTYAEPALARRLSLRAGGHLLVRCAAWWRRWPEGGSGRCRALTVLAYLQATA